MKQAAKGGMVALPFVGVRVGSSPSCDMYNNPLQISTSCTYVAVVMNMFDTLSGMISYVLGLETGK